MRSERPVFQEVARHLFPGYVKGLPNGDQAETLVTNALRRKNVTQTLNEASREKALGQAPGVHPPGLHLPVPNGSCFLPQGKGFLP